MKKPPFFIFSACVLFLPTVIPYSQTEGLFVRSGTVPNILFSETVRQKNLDAMVLVPGGTFIMGNASGDTNEKPLHQVLVRSFYMSAYELTQKEWEAVMGYNPSHIKGDLLPVENINWYEAVQFCNLLSAHNGLMPVYSGTGDDISLNLDADGYRLPTEAEWEFAARGGKTDNGFVPLFSGGNNINALGWFVDNIEGNGAKPVGLKQPNALGLYDMSGNVYEWCFDWYAPYTQKMQENPIGPFSGMRRVVRGGSWCNSALFCRITNRGFESPESRGIFRGLRLVRSALPA